MYRGFQYSGYIALDGRMTNDEPERMWKEADVA
jgi:hypothetical protein